MSVVDLVSKKLNLDISSSISWVCEKIGDRIQPPNNKIKNSFYKLRIGTNKELRILGELRCLSLDALKMATDRGFLFFTELFGKQAWAITDKRKQIVEYRRLDGNPWSAYGSLSERKSHCKGTGKSKPQSAI